MYYYYYYRWKSRLVANSSTSIFFSWKTFFRLVIMFQILRTVRWWMINDVDFLLDGILFEYFFLYFNKSFSKKCLKTTCGGRAKRTFIFLIIFLVYWIFNVRFHSSTLSVTQFYFISLIKFDKWIIVVAYNRDVVISI